MLNNLLKHVLKSINNELNNMFNMIQQTLQSCNECDLNASRRGKHTYCIKHFGVCDILHLFGSDVGIVLKLLFKGLDCAPLVHISSGQTHVWYMLHLFVGAYFEMYF